MLINSDRAKKFAVIFREEKEDKEFLSLIKMIENNIINCLRLGDFYVPVTLVLKMKDSDEVFIKDETMLRIIDELINNGYDIEITINNDKDFISVILGISWIYNDYWREDHYEDKEKILHLYK